VLCNYDYRLYNKWIKTYVEMLGEAKESSYI